MIKQRDLEILLSNLKTFNKPKIELEQYQTPPRLVAMIVHRAYMLGDIKNKTVIDLCCGTGLFAIASKKMGAIKVWGIDIDKDALEIAKINTKKSQTDIIWKQKDARQIKENAHTIFMNSPFGIQGEINDKYFLKAALDNSDVCYTIHLYQEKNIEFLEDFIQRQNKEIKEIIRAEFEIPKTYHFHKKRFHIIDVAIIRSM